jgi:hypothetical protein
MAAERDLDDDDDSEPVSAPPESVRSPEVPTITIPPATPRSIETEPTELDLRPPGSRSRPSLKGPGDPDTLISAPRPAEREELELLERVRLLEERIDELDARMRLVERRRSEGPAGRSQPWWIWLIFLVGLAVTWRLLEALR